MVIQLFLTKINEYVADEADYLIFHERVHAVLADL